MVQEEMKIISEVFKSGPDPLSLTSLTSFNFSETTTMLKNDAPVLWHVLQKAGWSVQQAKENMHKTAENVNYLIKLSIANLIYCRLSLTFLECYHSASHSTITDLQHSGPYT
jgi:hypothetical protein